MDNLALFRMEDFRTFKGEIIEEILKAMSSVKSDNEDKLFSPTELAQMLGVSKASITTYKNNGMPYKMVKRRPYFKLSEVENYKEREISSNILAHSIRDKIDRNLLKHKTMEDLRR